MVNDKETSLHSFNQQFRLPSFGHNIIPNNNNNNNKTVKNDVKVLELNLPNLNHHQRHHYRKSRMEFRPPRWLNGGE